MIFCTRCGNNYEQDKPNAKLCPDCRFKAHKQGQARAVLIRIYLGVKK